MTESYYQRNKEKILIRSKNYYQKNRVKVNKRKNKYHQDHKEERNRKRREKHALNPEKEQERGRKYYLDNKVAISKRAKIYRKNNREKTQARQNKYSRERCKTDPGFKLRVTLKSRMWKLLKKANATKSQATVEYLGCTISEFIQYIEAQFKPGMTWQSHGSYWHLDHRIPIATYDLSVPCEIEKAFHYTNLQPLEAGINLSKSASYSEPSLRQYCQGMLPESFN